MLTAFEIKRVAEQLQTLVPQLLELAEMDVQGARENLQRLNRDSNALIAGFKQLAVDQVRADLHSETAADREKLQAERSALAEERDAVLSQARQQAADIVSAAEREGEAMLAEYRARHEAAKKALG